MLNMFKVGILCIPMSVKTDCNSAVMSSPCLVLITFHCRQPYASAGNPAIYSLLLTHFASVKNFPVHSKFLSASKLCDGFWPSGFAYVGIPYLAALLTAWRPSAEIWGTNTLSVAYIESRRSPDSVWRTLPSCTNAAKLVRRIEVVRSPVVLGDAFGRLSNSMRRGGVRGTTSVLPAALRLEGGILSGRIREVVVYSRAISIFFCRSTPDCIFPLTCKNWSYFDKKCPGAGKNVHFLQSNL